MSTTRTVDETETKKIGFIAAAKATLLRFKAHNVMVIAAGIAFFGFLALIPTMAATMGIYGLVADPTEIVSTVERADGLEAETKAFVVTQLKTMTESKGLGVSVVAGILLALFSASGAVQKLMNTVSVAYATIESRKGLKVRGMAYLFTVGAILGFLLLVGTLGVLPAMADKIPGGGAVSVLVQILGYVIIVLGFYAGLTILYRYGPDRETKTPWKNVGAVVGTVLFLLFAFALSMYGRVAGSMPASYAILGVFASIMIFLQLASIAVIIGAEVNAVIEGEDLDPTRKGSHGTGRTGGDTTGKPDTATLSLAQAAAGVAAIFVLGKGN
ncbi:MAG: YihY/virulence factor BrkB family protein [Acidimicrobiales bacterium]